LRHFAASGVLALGMEAQSCDQIFMGSDSQEPMLLRTARYLTALARKD
jgi:hypothetical protein